MSSKPVPDCRSTVIRRERGPELCDPTGQNASAGQSAARPIHAPIARLHRPPTLTTPPRRETLRRSRSEPLVVAPGSLPQPPTVRPNHARYDRSPVQNPPAATGPNLAPAYAPRAQSRRSLRPDRGNLAANYHGSPASPENPFLRPRQRRRADDGECGFIGGIGCVSIFLGQ